MVRGGSHSQAASSKGASRRLFLAGAPALLALSCAGLGSRNAEVRPGQSGAFVFDEWAGAPLNVFTYAPMGLSSRTPLVLIMHGQGRNASEYRDQWIAMAEANTIAIAAPEFSRAHFPDAGDYNSGRRFYAAGRPVPVELWSFSAIEPLAAATRVRMALDGDDYAIYGHSAGAQFVHRFLLHMPNARVRRAVSANAGWYTLPDPEIAAPFGLGGEAVSEDALRAWLARPMTILLGTQDIDTEQSSLNRSPEAMQQGPHRLARGRFFFEAGRARAEALDAPFRWRLAYAPNINHDNSRMASHAVSYLVD